MFLTSVLNPSPPLHSFHGIFPSKNQQEKKQRKEAEDVKARQAATSENPSAELDRLQVCSAVRAPCVGVRVSGC